MWLRIPSKLQVPICLLFLALFLGACRSSEGESEGADTGAQTADTGEQSADGEEQSTDGGKHGTDAGDIQSAAPTAAFSHAPNQPEVGETVSFDASDSEAPGGSIAAYRWEFGDGTADTGETTSHKYNSKGTYDVVLTVTDEDGTADSTSRSVAVSGGPLLFDDFEDGTLGQDWTVSGEGTAGVDDRTSNSGSHAMFTGENSVEVATSSTFDLSETSGATLDYWVREGADSFSVDPAFNEDFIVEYRDDTDSWVTLIEYDGENEGGSRWDESFFLPAAALHDSFRIRFRRTDGRSTGRGVWHTDDVELAEATSVPTVEMKGHLNPRTPSRGSKYKGIWGYTTDGEEYALVTSEGEGLSIVDVTDPANPTEVDFVSLPDRARQLDVVTLGDYAYVGGAGEAKLRIVDLSGLPNSGVSHVKTLAAYENQIHTLHGTGDLLFLHSYRKDNGVHILDASDRENPTKVAEYDPQYMGHASKAHDSHVRGDLLYVALEIPDAPELTAIWDIVDISDPSNPTRIGRTEPLTDIVAHSNWLSEDGDVMYAFEEGNVKDVLIYDVSDPTAPTKIGEWQNDSDAAVHNGQVRGDFLHLAYYEDGYVLVDVSDPANPTKVGGYRTWSPAPVGGFDGAFNLYTGLPSGHILVSDTRNGLYVFDVQR